MAVSKFPVNDRAAHDELMLTDKDYAKAFYSCSIPLGRKFTVSLECMDQLGSTDLMASLFSKEQVLVAGCKVTRISFSDESEKLIEIKAKLQEILSTP